MLRNPQNVARKLLMADFCTVSDFLLQVAYSVVDLVRRERAEHHPAPRLQGYLYEPQEDEPLAGTEDFLCNAHLDIPAAVEALGPILNGAAHAPADPCYVGAHTGYVLSSHDGS